MTTKDGEQFRMKAQNPDHRRSACVGVRLQNRLRAFVGLIICTYAIFSLVLLLQIPDPQAFRRSGVSEAPLPKFSDGGGDKADYAAGGTVSHRRRWMGIGFLLTAALLATTYFYTRKLLGPLEEMHLTAERIARGRLDHSIVVRQKDEIGAIAECINDIAANQQEILLHLWNQTGHSIDLIDRITVGIANVGPNDGGVRIKRDLSSIRNSMETLRALAGGIGFYEVNLRDGKARAAGNHSGQGCRKAGDRAVADP